MEVCMALRLGEGIWARGWGEEGILLLGEMEEDGRTRRVLRCVSNGVEIEHKARQRTEQNTTE